MKTIKRLLKGERGFTLIELLAVMAIVATLAGIVSTSVSGTNETSKTAAAKQDASTTVSAAGAYFADQEAAEVLTPSTVTVTALFDGEVVADIPTEQKISTRWPETYITEAFEPSPNTADPTTPYTNEFPTANAAANTITVHVSILGKADSDDVRIPITRKELLEGYTAIDWWATEPRTTRGATRRRRRQARYRPPRPWTWTSTTSCGCSERPPAREAAARTTPGSSPSSSWRE